MSAIVRIIGENDGSDEYAAAEKLKTIINETVPNNAMGEIVLFPSATLYGQAVKDVDIMMIGSLNNYAVPVSFSHDNSFSEELVYLKSFCTTIEVKSHSISGIRKEGTNLQVYYSNSGWHNATKQSICQKTSAMQFFSNALGESPYITNLLWFVEVNEGELKNLLKIKDNEMPSNVLPNMFDFKEVVQLLAFQRMPWKSGGKYSIDSSFNGRDTDLISKPLLFFSKVKSGIGELTRKKIEQISQKELEGVGTAYKENALNILRGRAGTGKTVDLIRVAINLVEKESARVQILTYNRALVSDIRRLFALAELPDMFEEKCVSVNTMQSYFYGLINGCLYEGKLTGEEYLHHYMEYLVEMRDFLKSDKESKDIIKAICEDDPKLNWDYILIDEAQDWSEDEKELILLLFDNNHLIVADGGRQYVRILKPCDWTLVNDRNSIKLKNCLRQKNNLVKFVNLLAKELDSSSAPIIASEQMVGGKIVIIKDEASFFSTIKSERGELKKQGNEGYDMLFLVPPSLVSNNSEKSFLLKKEFEKKDILLWDGTNDNNRLEFSVELEESRVLQYESARGLEGWAVCCMNFDEFMEGKEKHFNPTESGDALMLESTEEKRNKYLLNWALIPVTRAIDTLIITLKDKESRYSRILFKLAESHPDYIQII